MRLPPAFLIAASIPFAVQADMDRWEVVAPVSGDPGAASAYEGAYVCPMDDPDVTGHFFCVALSCPPGEALEWSISAAGGVGVQPTITFDLAVDGARFGAVTLERRAGGDGDFSAPYLIGRDAAKLKAMRTGRRAVFTLSGALEGDFDVPLRGASAAIGHALERCRAR